MDCGKGETDADAKLTFENILKYGTKYLIKKIKILI